MQVLPFDESMRSLVVFCLLFALTNALDLIGRDQSCAVRGKLICGNRPAAGVLVKLWDEDDTDADDLLESGYTNANGDFHLSGWTKEVGPIDPKFNIFHDCEDGLMPCQRKFTIKIGNDYITNGKVPQRVYDAGVIQLAGKFPGESRDCIH